VCVNVSLVGFQSSGKSWIGATLAQRLATPFYDLDTLVLERGNSLFGSAYGSVRELFISIGEKSFRNLERLVLSEHKFYGILACGGGSPLDLLDSETIVVYLFRSFSTIWNDLEQKISDGASPAWIDLSSPFASFQQIWEERHPVFVERSRYTVLVKEMHRAVQDLHSIMVQAYGK